MFHRLYYHAFPTTWGNTWWFGVRILKNPLDLWIYQELLAELKPDLIIETGTAAGGSALYLASICDLLGNGKIVTIDIKDRSERPRHKRIRYVLGSSTDADIIDLVKQEVDAADVSTVLVILDSNHTASHVSRELELYTPFVTPGSYVIVEDTNVNGHPVMRSYGPGPMEGMRAFLATSSEFSVDRSREKFWLTFNPRGYLRRVGRPSKEVATTHSAGERQNTDLSA